MEAQALGFDSLAAAEADGVEYDAPAAQFTGILKLVTASSTRKATKAATLAAYDHFFWALRDFQGGTAEEQARGAKARYARLVELAATVAALAANPGKLALADEWLRTATTVDVPARLASFAARWAAQINPPPSKPVHGAPEQADTPADMQSAPPVPCKFKAGDRVTFTNDQGVRFPGKTVRGFTPEVILQGRFIYLDLDCWWFPVKPENLRLTIAV
jgi:hypothetical protein